MLSHRIDYAHLLIGRFKRLVTSLRNFIPTRRGSLSDVDDWVAMIADMDTGVTGAFESTKLATGRGEGYGGCDDVEINGAEGTIVYSTQSPLELRIGRKGASELDTIAVPHEFLVYPGSPRDARQGDPRITFRYDQSFEFIDAIANDRACRPSFRAGVEAQAVMDAAVISNEQRNWVEVEYPR
jgi:predicted dehydrogenase